MKSVMAKFKVTEENCGQLVFEATSAVSKAMSKTMMKALAEGNGKDQIMCLGLINYTLLAAVVTTKTEDTPREKVEEFLRKFTDQSVTAFMDSWDEVKAMVREGMNNEL